MLWCRCKASFILHGIVECYFVFDRTSYRTGLDTLKNTQPYPGVSLNFCALQLDGGPIKTSTICFDNSGIDPNHPYVIAKVGTSPVHPALVSSPMRRGLCLSAAYQPIPMS